MSARGLGHDRRLDGDRRSIPVAVCVHRGDSLARTLLPELPPALALGVCELALGSPPPVLGVVREVPEYLLPEEVTLDMAKRLIAYKQKIAEEWKEKKNKDTSDNETSEEPVVKRLTKFIKD